MSFICFCFSDLFYCWHGVGIVVLFGSDAFCRCYILFILLRLIEATECVVHTCAVYLHGDEREWRIHWADQHWYAPDWTRRRGGRIRAVIERRGG